MSPDQLLSLYRQVTALGVPAFIIFILFASYRHIWVWGSELTAKDVEIERERARYAALEERYRLLDEEKNRYAMIAFANERLVNRSVTAAKRIARNRT